MIELFDYSMPLVNPNGYATDQTQLALGLLTRDMVILGDGSPEGVVTAPQFSIYTDKTSTTPGAIDYRKMSTDIAGDVTKGWVAI